MYDPLLNNSSDQPWAPPVPESAMNPQITTPTPRASVDRRAMLEQLKAQRQVGVSTSETPADVPATSRTTKKSPRPARAAKILVFGLSTTAMFGAITGYALADIQQQQKSIPAQPVIAPEISPYVPAVSANSTATLQAATTEPSTTSSTKRVANKTQPNSAPAVISPSDTPVVAPTSPPAAAPADSADVVVDIPVPQAAQPGQGQSSGGKQQSSGSH